jgi:predicted nucleic acid-binding protein
LIVLDASLIVNWLISGQDIPGAPEMVDLLAADRITVPAHWPVEISNVLRTHIRGGRLTVDSMHDIFARLDMLNVIVEPAVPLDEVGSLANFAITHNLTAYDAAYVQLAFQRRAILATLDRAMRAAALPLDIPLLPV